MTNNNRAIRKWHIHLGVHKTATTHIQRELAARHAQLQAMGIYFLPLEKSRELLALRDVKRPLLWSLRKRLSPNLRQDKVFLYSRFVKQCAQSLNTQIEQAAAPAECVVLSEENLLGRTDQVFDDQYFFGLSRLNVIRELTATAQTHLFICLRTMDEFLPSAYAQSLRTTPAEHLNFDRYLARISDTPPSWVGLITRVRQLVPKADITVWDYSDYANNALAIQSLIAGSPLTASEMGGRPKQTVSPSARAIRMAEEVQENFWEKRLEIVNGIYETYPVSPTDPAFRPFSTEQSKRLKAKFSSDLDEIRQISGVTLMRF